MTNREFLHKYGRQEYYALSSSVYDILSVWRINKYIRGFKCNNAKKVAKIFLVNGGCIQVEYAQVLTEKNILRSKEGE